MPDPEQALPLSRSRPVDLGATQTEILVAPETLAPTFAKHRAFECLGLIQPALLADLVERCRRGTFVADDVEGLGSREVEAPQHVGRVLNLTLGRPAFLRWVEAVTGCERLVQVSGRVVQARANNVDALDWHDDLGEDARRLAITINLSDQPYNGGGFELREVASRRALATYRHQSPGTGLIFDVARDIEHRVLPVTSGGPRRVFTGWFMTDNRHY